MQISANAHAPLSLVICPWGRAGKRCGELLLKAAGSRGGGGMPCGISVWLGGLSPGAAWGMPPARPPCSRDQPSFRKSSRPREGRRGEGRGTASIDLIFSSPDTLARGSHGHTWRPLVCGKLCFSPGVHNGSSSHPPFTTPPQGSSSSAFSREIGICIA